MKMKMVVGVAIAIALAATVALLIKRPTVGNPPTVKDPVNVSLRMPIPAVDTAFSPYYLAIDKGLFAHHGLTVTIQPGTPELNPVKMLSQGIDQFAVLGGPELLFTARSKGAPLVAIAQLHKDSDFTVLLTKQSSGITKLSQLEGKRVGFFYGHISTDILRILFRKEGINVQEVDVGFDYGQFLTDKLAAQWAFRTTAGIQLPAKGTPVNIISPADYGIHAQGHILVTTEKMIQERPQEVQAFLDAVIEGISLSLENEDEAVASSVRRDPNFSPEVGKKQLAIYNPTIRRNAKIGWISSADMEKTKEQMLVTGLIPPGFDIHSAFDIRFLDKHYADRP